MGNRSSARVKFANKKMEEDYRRLSRSEHPEDRKTFEVLRRIRATLAEDFPSGTPLPHDHVPPVYRSMLGAKMLLKLDLGELGAVFYFKEGDSIKIVDVI
jgi:hypothetical protein